MKNDVSPIEVGRRVFYHPGRTTLTFAVGIKQVRRAYGREEYLITPEDGSGEQWVTRGMLRTTLEQWEKEGANANAH